MRNRKYILLLLAGTVSLPTAQARDAYSRIEAEAYNGNYWVKKTSSYITDADVLRYDQVDFGAFQGAAVQMRLAVPKSLAGRRIEVRKGAANGPLLASFRTQSTGNATTYKVQSAALAAVTGPQTIFLVFPDSEPLGRLDYFVFTKGAAVPPPTPPTPPSTPPTPTPTPTPTPVPVASCPAGSINVVAGANIQTAVNGAAEGASFCLRAGEHRMQSVRPKNNQKFYGETGAVMNGSRLLTSFSREGSYFVATGQTQQGERIAADECADGMPRCGYPEAFYINDKALVHVASKSAVAPGKYFFDYANKSIYFLDDPAGKKVETAVSPNAFGGNATGVTVQGLAITKYASPLQRCAVQGRAGWVVRSNDITLNYGIGVCVEGNGRILTNKIRGNGEMGLACVGDDILIEGNEISHNGYFSGIDTAWEGGGSKCALTNRLVVRNNYSHRNNGYGLWTDIDNVNTLYEGNRLEANMFAGISHEISYAAVIRNNTLVGNGAGGHPWLWGAGIQVQNSQSVEVYNNRVEIPAAGGNGIALIQQNRGAGAYGPYDTINNYVHHNVIVSASPEFASGMIADFNPALMQAGNNRFDYNRYFTPDPSNDFFGWGDTFYTWSTLRSRWGQEANGTMNVGAP